MIGRNLQTLYRSEPCLHKYNFGSEGFEWLEMSDADNSVISYMRKADHDYIIVILNFTPTKHDAYELGVHEDRHLEEIFNSDNDAYYGSGSLNGNVFKPAKVEKHGKPYSIHITLPSLSGIILRLKK